MWSIHMYMQLGFLALAAIIHVSDQPVEPSSGMADDRDCRPPCMRLTWNCQVVPTTMSPAVNASICSPTAPQYGRDVALLLEQVDRRLELRRRRAGTGR